MAILAVGAVGLIVAVSPVDAASHHHRAHSAHRSKMYRPSRREEGRRPHASSVSPTITCRYADGTPYDPDVIGGPNHVGDGGPAANLGGFDPCAY